VVEFGLATLALKHANGHCVLVICCGREDLALLSRDDGVARDDGGEDSAGSFNAKGERVDIEEENVPKAALDTCEDTTLNGSAIGDCLIGVNAFEWFFPEVILQELLNSWNSG